MDHSFETDALTAERALSAALAAAAAAGRFDVVTALARELEARRLAIVLPLRRASKQN